MAQNADPDIVLDTAMAFDTVGTDAFGTLMSALAILRYTPPFTKNKDEAISMIMWELFYLLDEHGHLPLDRLAKLSAEDKPICELALKHLFDGITVGRLGTKTESSASDSQVTRKNYLYGAAVSLYLMLQRGTFLTRTGEPPPASGSTQGYASNLGTYLNSDEFIAMFEAIAKQEESAHEYLFEGDVPTPFLDGNANILMHSAINYILGTIPQRPLHEFYRRHFSLFRVWNCLVADGSQRDHVASYLFDGRRFFQIPESVLYYTVISAESDWYREMEVDLSYSKEFEALMVQRYAHPAYHEKIELILHANGTSLSVERIIHSMQATR